ncbi:MAG: MBOAT family protein [Verrucomicrobia bacterium]|nr:MBOAT family protein [Verrucomicrobiota bacterium]
MLFNSHVFLLFFAAFLLLYWLARANLRTRNALIVAASYVFYGWWDARFLALILLSTALDYGVGLALARTPQPGPRKRWLALSLVGNLGILGFFKYFNFFAGSAEAALARLGLSVPLPALNVVLPVGISFYTFQTMGYAIDVYRGALPPTRNLLNFMAYVAFFPQLVAGPIERGRDLLPQFERPLHLGRARLDEGLWLMLWGMFKKVVVADNLAPVVDLAYQGDPGGAPAVILGTLAFALQIYGDFSGYSDIARGAAAMLGFDLMVNFNLPYTATNLREFWQRWHISLSTWLRDYLYISLGGNRRGPGRTCVNLVITMLLGGLWHGAAWNFVLWGLWHSAGLAAHRAFRNRRLPPRANPKPARPPRVATRVASWAATFGFVLYGWLLFRARSLDQIAALTRSLGDWTAPPWLGSALVNVTAFALPLVLMELWQHRQGSLLAPLRLPRWRRAVLQAALLLAIVMFWTKDQPPFLYFQF